MKALVSVLAVAVVSTPALCQKSKVPLTIVGGTNPAATKTATGPAPAAQPASAAAAVPASPATAAPSEPVPPAAMARFAPGAKLFIEPMNGFETYLEGAILKKNVPVTVVDDRSKADFVVTGISDEAKAGWAKVIFVSPKSHAQASIAVKDARSGNLVFAYNVDKSNAIRANQSTAEACAKHLKTALEKN